MTSFGEKLRALREQKEITQEELGRILNVKKAAISKYEGDKISMSLDSIKLLADYFGVPFAYFINNEPLVGLKINKLPILGTIRAGLPILADEHIEDYLEVPDYMVADYVLTVTGDSMIGVGILDGDLAICKKSEEPQTGQIIVAKKDISVEYSEATLKFYFTGNGQPVLRAANPNYPDIDYYGEKYTTVGHLVSVVRRDVPGYQLYREFLTVKDHEEWTEVIEKAASYGISPKQLAGNLDMQWEMIQRMKKK